MGNQQNSSGVQRGCRSEPPRPRPSSPAPSTIFPSDSISVRGEETGSSKQTRPSVEPGNFRRPQNGYSQPSAPKPAVSRWETPQVSPQQAAPYFGWEPYDYEDQYAPSSFENHPQPSVTGTSQTSFRTPSTSTQQAPPSSSRSNVPSSVRDTPAPSTARVTNRQASEVLQSVASRAAPASTGGSCTGSSRQNRPVGHSGVLSQQSAGPQPPQGISIGVPPAAQMHFHYNQVDNRQLHISNVSMGLFFFHSPEFITSGTVAVN